MDERMRFIVAMEEEENVAALCREFGISRKTGYKLMGRYAREGADGLKDRSRAPLHHPNEVDAALEERIVALRRARPRWGPRKLLARLMTVEPAVGWPAASTIGGILKQHGLVVPRRRRGVTPADLSPFVACTGPNAAWCVDFKGWFRTGDGRRCDPLTISDAFSRYLLRCQAVRRPNECQVRPLFEATFREYGLPRAIRSDNGPPFASRAAGGLSRLSVWWIKLGIRAERITPGRPAENGRHERMHRTLKEEACMPPAAGRRAQQRRFDEFRRSYNDERPHEALDNATPGSRYEASPRPYPERLPELAYPDAWQIRRVRPSGEIKWRGATIYISQVLADEPIGIEPIDDGAWRLYFGPVLLGTLNAAGRLHLAGYRRRERDALRSRMAPRAALATTPVT